MLYFHRCMPHTSFLGFFTAHAIAVTPCLGEIANLIFSYNAKSRDHQAIVPSFWFRTWRPGFLIAGMLYDIGMLAYCIYTEDITAVLLIVRLLIVMYQLSDQYWMVKHWIPFFVQKQKQRLIFLRIYFIVCIWMFVLCFSNSWTNSWQQRNHIFGNVYYINIFVITSGVGLPYLMQGGLDFFVKYRLHWNRNIYLLLACTGTIEGIVGLSIGDGGGNNLVDTLDYHSALVPIYSFVEFMIGVLVHYFVVIFEEFSWKCPNSIPLPDSSSPSSVSPSTLFPSESLKTIRGNRVACDVDSRCSSVEVSPLERILEEAVEEDMVEAGLSENPMMKSDEKCEIASTSNTAAASDVATRRRSSMIEEFTRVKSIFTETIAMSAMGNGIHGSLKDNGSNVISFRSHRRNALAFDGITRRASILRSTIITHEILIVKLKRHELVCRELDKLYCILYQMYVWEVVMWLAQIFLALYLQSVNTPFPPGAEGYYCPTPKDNVINSAQFVNDFVFARRR